MYLATTINIGGVLNMVSPPTIGMFFRKTSTKEPGNEDLRGQGFQFKFERLCLLLKQLFIIVSQQILKLPTSLLIL